MNAKQKDKAGLGSVYSKYKNLKKKLENSNKSNKFIWADN